MRRIIVTGAGVVFMVALVVLYVFGEEVELD